MSKKGQFLTVIFLLVLYSQTAFSQIREERQKLADIFQEISIQHTVEFSFLEQEIDEISIVPPAKHLTLAGKLLYLETATNFIFNILQGGYISVSSKGNPITSSTGVESHISLNEIVINRFLTTGITKKRDGSVEVNPKKFSILPGLTEPDVLQTIQQIPGIYSADQNMSNINIRSGSHDQNLFLWNGIRLYQTGHFFGLISVFNSSAVKKVNVIKNGTSAFFGESISSVIDISSHAQHHEKYDTEVDVNLISAAFTTKIKMPRNSYIQFAGRRSLTDFFPTATYERYAERAFQRTLVTNVAEDTPVDYRVEEDFYFYDFTAQYHATWNDKTTIDLDVIGIANKLDFLQESSSESAVSGIDQVNYGGKIMIDHQLNDRNTLQFSAYASYYKLYGLNDVINNNQRLEQTNEVMDAGLKISNSLIFSNNTVLKAGYQYNELGISNSASINNPDFRQKVREVSRFHAFIMESKTLSNDTGMQLRLGLRTNYIEDFNRFIVEPRFQFSYQLNGSISLELAGEFKSQFTSQIIEQQQDFLGIEKRRWMLANDKDIPIQQSKQLSAGFNFRNKDWIFIMDNYIKYAEGIHSRSQGFQNQLEFEVLTGRTNSFGTELLLQREVGAFTTWISYGFTQSTYYFADYRPAKFPGNFEVRHAVSWAGIFEWNRFKVALGSNWHSGRPETAPATSDLNLGNPSSPSIIYKDPNSSTIADFFECNFSMLYTLKDTGKCSIQFGLSVLNVFNNENTVNRYYRLDRSNDIERVDIYSMRRTPNVSLQVKF